MLMFNHFLKRMHESGVIDKMNRDWSLREEIDFEFDPAVTLGYENVAFPFIILIGGLAFSCILTMLEKGLRKSAEPIKGRPKERDRKKYPRDRIVRKRLVRIST